MQRLIKSSTLKLVAPLDDSDLFHCRDSIKTDCYALNIALSGDMDGGLTSGSTILAGPSRHFKSKIGLILMKAYMDKYPEAIGMYYDNEFGTTPDYFADSGIDTSRVVHNPLLNLEEYKFDIVKQLDEMQRGEKIFFFTDSLGNAASKRELDNALKESGAEDYSRAKVIKGVMRMITPYLTIKDIPYVAIAHIYETMALYAQKVVSGGTGIMLGANNVYIIGRQQEREDEELIGYKFILNSEKSRFIKEKSKIPLMVYFDGGINKYSGLFDIAEEGQYIVSPSKGWYQRVINDENGVIQADKKWRRGDTDTEDFWEPIFQKTDFKHFVKKTYKLVQETPANTTTQP